MNDSDIVRERAAWFNNGVAVLAAYSALAVIALGACIGIATFFLDVSILQAISFLVIGSCGAIAVASQLLSFSARERARRGGVEVDRF